MTDRKALARRPLPHVAFLTCALLGLFSPLAVGQNVTGDESNAVEERTVVEQSALPEAQPQSPGAALDQAEALQQIEVREVRERPAVTPTLDLTENPAN